MKNARILFCHLLLPVVAFASSYDAIREVEKALSFAKLNAASTAMKVVESENFFATQTAEGGIDLQISKGKVLKAKSGLFISGAKDSHIIFQDLKAGGHRALIHIASDKDPTSYAFKVLGAAQLTLKEDGSVEALDENGAMLALIKAPWATDGSGKDVPTYFTVDGTMLTQIVAHQNGSFAYGIIADPFWVPAALALRACMAHPVCREVAKQGTKAAVKWAIEHLF